MRYHQTVQSYYLNFYQE